MTTYGDCFFRGNFQLKNNLHTFRKKKHFSSKLFKRGLELFVFQKLRKDSYERRLKENLTKTNTGQVVSITRFALKYICVCKVVLTFLLVGIFWFLKNDSATYNRNKIAFLSFYIRIIFFKLLKKCHILCFYACPCGACPCRASPRSAHSSLSSCVLPRQAHTHHARPCCACPGRAQ